MEIAVDKKYFEEHPTDFVSLRDEVIDFLKNNIIEGYHKFYKDKFGKSVTDSFILFTKVIYEELSGFDKAVKKSCEEIHYGEYIFYNLPIKIFKNKIRVLSFLKKIGQSMSDYSGAFIDRIFIPPNGYDEIKRKPKENGLVFITGPPGIGKTYVAIRLLWEWYIKGYTPEWITGKDEYERRNARDKLIGIRNLLGKKHIIYFEDVFGKIKYERREDLEDRISGIIDSIIKNKQDCFIIITSSEEVFKLFEKTSLGEDIKNFKVSLDIKKSYNYVQKKEILKKWAEEKGCKWLKNDHLKQIVLESLKEANVLPTPLSIHEFIVSSVEIDDERQLIQQINTYSKVAEKAIAEEIIALYDNGRKDRFLLLSFIFVSQRLTIDFINKIYNEMKEQDFKEFDELLKEEHRLKTEIDLRGNEILAFGHSIYADALSFILNHTGCRNIFSHILEKLANQENTVGEVVWIIMKYYDNLPKNTKDIIFRLASNDDSAPHISTALLWNFDKLPPKDRDKLLLSLAEKNGTSEYLVWAIMEHLDEISIDVLNEVFSRLYQQRSASVDIAIAFNSDFNKCVEILKKLRNDIRLNILKNLADHEESAFFVAKILSTNVLDLSDKEKNILIDKLWCREESTNSVIDIINQFIEYLPQDLRRFLEVSKFKKYAIGYVIWSIVRECSSNNKLRELLSRLATNKETMKDVAEAIGFYYPSLSAEVQNILNENSIKVLCCTTHPTPANSSLTSLISSLKI